MTTQEAFFWGGGGCWETGVLSGENDILQNWKIRFVFLYIPMCWITFLPCILSIGNLWKSEIGRDSVLLNYQIFFFSVSMFGNAITIIFSINFLIEIYSDY